MNITNEKVNEYINSFYKEIDNQLLELRQECEEKGIPIILKETESFLISMLNIIKPKKILEIGTAEGYSSVMMARTLKDVKIETIEKSKKAFDCAKKNIEKLKLNKEIRVALGDPSEEALVLIENHYDLIFIDAAKSKYMEFWEMSIKKSKPGTVIICDNVLMRATIVDESYDTSRRFRTSIKKMKEFLDYIMNLEGVQTSIIPVGDGVSISYVK